MKYKGKDLSLTIDGEETNLEATTINLENEEADEDALTFAEYSAQNGVPVQWFFTIEAVADYGVNSLWTLLWDNSGETIPFVFKPFGNATATAAQPHFTGNARVTAKPPIGGTAGEVFTFEARLDLDGEPTRVVA